MKTVEEIVSSYKSNTLNGCDLRRLAAFIPEEHFPRLGLSLKPEYIGKHTVKPITREAILEQLEEDLAFAFEKALGMRGISSAIMYEVVGMWNWILEEGLEGFEEYTYYGLPLFKATAEKYNFANPIGDDTGREVKYASEEARMGNWETGVTKKAYVPVTPAGTPCTWLASKTEDMAWRKLLWDARHMLYSGIAGFKARGYTVECWKGISPEDLR